MKKLIERLFGRKAALRPVQTITEERLAEMFLHVPGTPGWQATLAVLDAETQEACDRAVDERLTNEQMRFRIGGVSALLELKATLLEREEQARKVQADLGTTPG